MTLNNLSLILRTFNYQGNHIPHPCDVSLLGTDPQIVEAIFQTKLAWFVSCY